MYNYEYMKYLTSSNADKFKETESKKNISVNSLLSSLLKYATSLKKV